MPVGSCSTVQKHAVSYQQSILADGLNWPLASTLNDRRPSCVCSVMHFPRGRGRGAYTSMARSALLPLCLALMISTASAFGGAVTPSLFPASGGEASISYKISDGLDHSKVRCRFHDGVETKGTSLEDVSGKRTVL